MTTVRVSIVQPYLPHYSAAFFRQLSETDILSGIQIIADLKSSGDLNTVATDNKLDIVHIPYKSGLGFAFRPGRLKALNRYHADICVLSADPRDILSLFLAAWLRLRGKKVIFWGMFHRIGGPSFVSQFMYAMMARLSNACISYAKVGGRNLLSVGAHPEKVFIGGTAINEQISFAASSKISDTDLSTFQKEWRLEGKKIILQVVRLSKIKKPLLLIDLAKTLLDRGHKDFLIIVLGGGEMLSEFNAKVKDMQLEEYVRVLPPEYNEDVLARWFLSADVFTIPTCIGLSLHHAFSYGVPIVTDDSLVNQASEFEALVDGINGLTYPTGDIHAYANAIAEILDNPETQDRMSTNALYTVKNIYSISNKVKSFVRVFQHVSRKQP